MLLTFWQKARYWALLLLVFLITLSSHPTIVATSRAAGVENGTILSRYIILVFAGLFLMCLNVKSMLKPKMIRACWIMWVCIVVYYLITFAVFGSKSMMSDIRSIAICLVAIMIGWQLDLDEKKLKIVLIAFSGLILFVGLMQVFTNVGGFVILDQYETDNKNSLGVMLVSGCFAFLVLGMNSNSKRIVRLLWFALAVLSMVVLLTIRARAATLTGGMMFLYVLYERYKGKNFFIYFLLAVFVAVIVYLVLPSSVKDFIYNSFFQNYEEGDITSGRGERNAAALEFLSYHLLLGNLNQNAQMGWIHNYPLNRTFEFGLVFVFPILLLYLFIMGKAIVKTIQSDNHNNFNIGYYLLLIPFVISMAEPTFPFGPGTATVFNFITFGLALRNTYNEKTLVN